MNALLVGAGVTILFILLVFPSPNHDVKIGFITYLANVNALGSLVSLVSLVSFGVSGIYLSALMTVIGSMVARSRGWIPEGQFRLGRWGWPVSIAGAVYLALMPLNVVAPTLLSSPRGYFNLDWITLLVIFLIAVVGGLYFFVSRPDQGVSRHLHDTAEPTGAERA